MTAATYRTPKALATYLRRATLGLPPERREEVWNELEEHVLCRAEQLEFQGLSPDAALAQALRELGPPLRVSAGMNGVHNMPKMIAFGTVTLLAISAGLYALAQQPAVTMQVPVQTRAPRIQCVKPGEVQPALPLVVKTNRVNCYQDDNGTQEGLYVSFGEVERALKPLGLHAKPSEDGGTLYFKNSLGQTLTSSYAVFKKGDESYLAVSDLIIMVMDSNFMPAQVSGYDQPVFKLNNASNFVMQGQGQEFSQRVYRTVAESATLHFYDFSNMSNAWSYEFKQPSAQDVERVIATPFKAGEVIASYQWVADKTQTLADGRSYANHTIVLTIGVTDAQGNVKLKLPQNASFTTTTPAKMGNDVLLVKLTNTPLGDMKSGAFKPVR